VTACYEKARELIKKNRKQLDRIAEMLIEKETLEGPQLQELLAGVERAS
jgi:cell division protease FtsH